MFKTVLTSVIYQQLLTLAKRLVSFLPLVTPPSLLTSDQSGPALELYKERWLIMNTQMLPES